MRDGLPWDKQVCRKISLGSKKEIGDIMFRKVLMSAVAAAAMMGVCATAQAQVLVEIEGPLSAYTATTANSGTLTVMNNKISVTADTAFVSPTETRADLFSERARNGAHAVYNVTN